MALAMMCSLVGYRVGSRRAFICDQRAANTPDITTAQPARWNEPAADAGADSTAAPAPAAPANGAIVLDAARPLRITWPLDIGPAPAAAGDGPGPVCLRARQGVNELQTPGAGVAVYGFRLQGAAVCKTWFHVRWGADARGSIMCNNSWFAGFDAAPSAVIGNETKEREWFWQSGPNVELSAGVHWVRVELREDGPCMDKIAIAPAPANVTPADLDKIRPASFHTLAGRRFPRDPAHPVQGAEFYALPTASLVIGQGHGNEVTVCASHQAGDGGGFRGMIGVHCPTAPGVMVQGDREVVCDRATPFVRRVLQLKFPETLPRRFHQAVVTIAAHDGTVVFRTEIRFIKGLAWAFLGPFRDTSVGSRKLYRYSGAAGRLEQACDAAPLRLARRVAPAALGLAALPLAGDAPAAAWRVVADGSCYDWTGAIDLQCVYGETKPAFAYAVTWINAETTLHHRSFTFQADDSGWLWVNGHRVVDLPIDLPREANRLWTSAPLSKGVNPVVVKLTQNQAYWGFRFDVIDWHWQGRRGDVVTGVAPNAWPGE